MTELATWQWPPAWWQETLPNDVGCQCTSDGGKKGWTLSADGSTWVHGLCGQPSLATIEREQQVLNLMRYGPHHHELHETSELTRESDKSWIANYRWTPEVVYGSQSGAPARVWVYRGTDEQGQAGLAYP